jgi:acyl-CoA oxidase
MPGIKVGDVGEKIGYSNVDNGFLSFEHYRIPRKALLARFMSITKTGDFKMKANPKIIYQIMVQTRLMIMFGASLNLSRASVVATRYAVCRRQFANVKGSSQERKLIDYQTHMDILAPNIAAGLCLNMAGREINEKIVKKSNKMIMEDDYKLLDVLHHFTSGLKALGGEMAYNGLDEMRQACGGAGFLTASGIASLWEDVAPYATYEGVNVVMF